MKKCPHCGKDLKVPYICDICGEPVEKRHRNKRCWECSLIVLEEHKKLMKQVRLMAIENAKKRVKGEG